MLESSTLLIDENPMLVLPKLATAIGLNESIFLQQVHYWCRHNRSDRGHWHEGRCWTYNNLEQWQEHFPWWGLTTIKSIVKSLRAAGLLLAGNFNKKGYDRTLWYTVDYDRLEDFAKNEAIGRNPTDGWTGTDSPIPETTPETSCISLVMEGVGEGSEERGESTRRTSSPIPGFIRRLNSQEVEYGFLETRLKATETIASGLHGTCREQQFSMLKTIRRWPRPTYKQVSKTERVYCYGPWQNLKASVRETLLEGTVGVDLVACQFAVVAKLWGLRDAETYLSGDIWQKLSQQSRLTKEQLKDIVYPALYGRSWTVAEKKLAKELGVDRAKAKQILRTPMLKSLFDARDTKIEAHLSGEPIKDCWGRSLPTGNRDEICSSLACQAQSYEYLLLQPAIDLVLERKVPVYLWLHDGFYCDRSVVPLLDTITRLVQARAESLGVRTRLEVNLEVGSTA